MPACRIGSPSLHATLVKPLFYHATTSPTCYGFVAERHAYTTSSAAALATARHSSANASSVTFTVDVAISKPKSDLFLQAVITAYLKGVVTL